MNRALENAIFTVLEAAAVNLLLIWPGCHTLTNWPPAGDTRGKFHLLHQLDKYITDFRST